MSKALFEANKLGISNADIKSAIFLIRDLRQKALAQGLNPRAIRIAILYLERTDKHAAEKKISFKEMNKLRQIANRLYEETAQRLLR